MPPNAGNDHPRDSSKPSRNLLLGSARMLWRFKKTAVIASGAAYCLYKFQQWKLRNELNKQIIDGTVLTWSITNGSIIETDTATSGFGPFGKVVDSLLQPSHQIRMLDALVALEMAAVDPRIKSLIVRVHNGESTDARSMSTGLGIAQTQELRQALERFQQRKEQQHGSGKGKSYFYIDSFDDQQTYYLASAFSDIIMQPTGYLPLTGISATNMYFKDLIEKLGIHMHVEARKDYKGVVAPFSQSSMPEKHRKNMMDILESLNSTFIRDTARSRKVAILSNAQVTGEDQPATAAEIMRGVLEEGPISAPYAKKLGLITAQDFIFDVESIIGIRKAMSLSNYRKQRGKEHWASIITSIMGKNEDGTSLNMHEQKDSSQPGLIATVGIVYLVGNIERHGTNSAERIAHHLLDAARDINVDAIVLRIDSGGGDVIASETIGAAVDYIQTNFSKPVVASYGNISASGAYYASTSCKRIFASPGTITGSIGVAAMRPIITRKLLDYIGTNVEELYVIDNKSNSSFTEPQGSELERYRKLVDEIYEGFTKRVAKDRGYSNEDVEEVAQGRVFTGIQALSNGLVDEMGSFTRAIESAAELGSKVMLETKLKTLRRTLQLHRNNVLQAAVTLGHFKSLDEAEKKLDNASPDAESKTTNSASSSDNNNESKLESFMDKLEIIASEPAKFKRPFKGDITRNILLKEFPQQKQLAKWVFNSIIKQEVDDDGDFGFSPTTSARMSAQDAAKNVVLAVLKDEINALLSGDSLRTLEKSAEQGRSVRAESDNTRFK
ncbi:hypothetical protein H4R24_000535 [Coemansia sp. RSA 988]|nr:hypothetical protein H4R24_000535 [Coemansia sp. RSA 988]